MQGLVKNCLKMCAVDLTEVPSQVFFNERSMRFRFSTGVFAEFEIVWNLDSKSRRRACSSALRTATPKIEDKIQRVEEARRRDEEEEMLKREEAEAKQREIEEKAKEAAEASRAGTRS